MITDGMKELRPETANDLLDKVAHVVPHHGGFTKDEICTIFEKAGLTEVDHRYGAEAVVQGNTLTFFVARGIKH